MGVAPRSAFAASATKVHGTINVVALGQIVSSAQTRSDGWGRDSYRAQAVNAIGGVIEELR